MINNSRALREIIVKKIENEGPISFKDFMALALYEEKYGYYSQSEIRIGKDGDFVTAPHTSKLFGYLIAVQIRQFFDIGFDKGPFQICEFGAGTGMLAKDILEYFKKFLPEYYKDLEYKVVEPLPVRQEVLSEVFEDVKERFSLVKDFSQLENFKGVIIANELFDAFPVHVIEKSDDIFHEIFVDVDSSGNLVESFREVTEPQLKSYIERHLGHLPNGYRTEINLELKKWIEKLATNFEKGFFLTIDYGYSRQEYYADYRNRGTLLGYTRQKITEEFLNFPGLIDMTAHVNFSDVKEWFEEAGFRSEGYTPQWAFLGGLDIEDTVEKAFGRLDPFSPVLAGVKSLIFPQGMGESHKVFVASKEMDGNFELKGFAMKNDIERLAH